jgi:hypothetical protein
VEQCAAPISPLRFPVTRATGRRRDWQRIQGQCGGLKGRETPCVRLQLPFHILTTAKQRIRRLVPVLVYIAPIPTPPSRSHICISKCSISVGISSKYWDVVRVWFRVRYPSRGASDGLGGVVVPILGLLCLPCSAMVESQSPSASKPGRFARPNKVREHYGVIRICGNWI